MRRISRYMPSAAVTVGVLGLAVGLGGVAFASIPDGSGVIHACYATSGGALRVIDTAKPGATGKCRATESPLAFSQRGLRGAQGIPGPVTGVLPSGVSEKGAFVARDLHADTSGTYDTAISFPLTLSAGVSAYYVPSGGTVPQCTGSAADPTAPRGALCVYESVEANTAGTPGFIDPVTTSSTSTTRPFGVILRGYSVNAGDAYIYGSWAVTAP